MARAGFFVADVEPLSENVHAHAATASSGSVERSVNWIVCPASGTLASCPGSGVAAAQAKSDAEARSATTARVAVAVRPALSVTVRVIVRGP